MTHRRISIIAIAAAAALTLAGCSAEEPAASAADSECTPVHEGLETIKAGVLTVAHYDYPPFATVENGELVGVEGEVLNKIAEMECLDIEIVEGDSAAMISSVATGRADTTLGSWYRTAERAKTVRLGAPIVTSPLAIVSATGMESADDLLDGGQIGVGQGLVANEDLQALLGGSLSLYPNIDAAFSDLQSGRIQGVVLGLGAAITQLELNPVDDAEILPIEPDDRIKSTVSPGQTNFPVALDAEALGEAMDDGIQTIRESGELEEIAVKYGFPAETADPGEPNEL